MKTITKIIWVFCIVVLFCGCTKTKSSKKNDWDELKLKGKVKSVIVTYSKEKLGKIVQKNKMSKFLFDANGNKIEEYLYYMDSENDLEYKYIYKYDATKMVEKNKYNSRGDLEYTCKYDTNGRKIAENTYNSAGHISHKKTYKYDANGNKIEMQIYNSEGKVSYKYTYKYDAKNNNIEENEYNNEAYRGCKKIRKYDVNGNNIEEKWYNLEGTLTHKECTTYDTNGNVLSGSMCSFNPDGSVNGGEEHTFKFEYDKKGNWIKVVTSVNSLGERECTERTIEYFD